MPSVALAGFRLGCQVTLQTRDKWLIAGVSAMAFFLRVWPAMRGGLSWTTSINPYDATGYVQLAEGFAHGCGFARWVDSACSAPESLRVPGYPGFVAIVGSLRIVVVLQAATGALVCLLLAASIIKRWGLAAALGAELAFALDVPSAVWASQIMTESLFQLIATAAILGVIAAIETTRNRDRILGSLGVGGALALSILVKSIGQLIVPLAGIALLITPGSRRTRWFSALLVVLIPAVIVAGWTARNSARTGAPVYALEEAGQLYLYRGASVIAYREHKDFSEVQQELWNNLGLPQDVTLKVSGPVSPLQGQSAIEMMHRGAQIAIRHPMVLAIVIARSFLYLALTPGLTDLRVWLEPSLSQQLNERGDPYAIANASVISSKLRNLGSSPILIQAIVYSYWVLLAFVWTGVARSLWKCRHLTTSEMAPMLLPFCVAIVLMLAASGPEGGARFRAPSMPFLDYLAAIGWLGKRAV